MKTARKILSILLVLLMCITSLPMTLASAEGYLYGEDTVCGNTTHTNYQYSCGAVHCYQCDKNFYHDTDEHVYGEMTLAGIKADNVCKQCYYYTGGELKQGNNTVTLKSDSQSAIKFVPTETGKRTITFNYNNDNTSRYITVSKAGNVGQTEAYGLKGVDCKLEYEFTAGETYYFAFLIKDGNSNRMSGNFNIHISCADGSHTKADGAVQTCKGYVCTTCGEYFGEKGNHKKDDDAVQTCKGYMCSECGECFGEKGDHKANEDWGQTCIGYFCDYCNEFYGEKGTAHYAGENNFCNFCNAYVGERDLRVGTNKITSADLSKDESESNAKYIRFIPKVSGTYTISSDMVHSNYEAYIMVDAENNQLGINRESSEFEVALTANEEYFFAFMSQSGKTDFTLTITAPSDHTHTWGDTQNCLGKYCSVCGGYDGSTGGSHTKADNAKQTCLGYKCTVCGEYFGDKSTTHAMETNACGDSYCTVCGKTVENANATHSDGNDEFNNVCDKCYKYLGTKEISVGENKLTATELCSISGDSPYSLIEFVPTMGGKYTISTDMTSNNGEIWFLLSKAVFQDFSSGIIASNMYDDPAEVTLTTGEEYYFVFASYSNKTDFTLTITAPEHDHSWGTTLTCKGYQCSICGVYDGSTGGSHTKADNAKQTCLGYKCTLCGEYFGEKSNHTLETTACGGSYCTVCNTYIDNDNTKHSDGYDAFGNICDKCYKYLGTKEIYVGDNAVAVGDVSVCVRFVPKMSGTYTISGATYNNGETWVMADETIIRTGEGSPIAGNYQNDTVKVSLTAGEEYYFIFYLNGSAGFTLNVAAPEHTHSWGTTLTCKGKQCSVCGGYDGTTGGSHTKADDAVQTCSGYKCTVCGEYFGDKGTAHFDGNDYFHNLCDICYEYIGTRDLAVGDNAITIADISIYGNYTMIRFIPKMGGEYTISSDMIYNSNQMWYIDDKEIIMTLGDAIADNSEGETVKVTLTADKEYYFMFYSYSDKSDFTLTITPPEHDHSWGTTLTCKGYQCSLCGAYDGTTGGSHTKADNAKQTCLGYKCTLCGEYFGEKGTTHTDGEGKYDLINICDDCHKYLGTKDFHVGENAVTSADIPTDTRDILIRFIPKMDGEYTISSDMTYNDGESWYLAGEKYAKDGGGLLLKSNSTGDTAKVTLTAGKEYYFFFNVDSTKTSFTLTITAPEHNCEGGTVQTCKGYVCTICGQYYGEKGTTHTKADDAKQTCLGYKCTVCGEYFGDKGTTHTLETTACGGSHCKLCGTYIDNENTTHTDGDDIYGNVCDLCFEYIRTADFTVGDNSVTADDLMKLDNGGNVKQFKFVRFIPALSGEYTISSDMVSGDIDDYENWYLYDNLFANGDSLASNMSGDKEIKVTLTANRAYYFMFLSESNKTDFTLTITAPAHTCTGGTVQTCKGYVCTICGQYYGEKGTTHTKTDSTVQTCLGYKCTTCGEYFGEKSTTHTLETTACGGGHCKLCGTYIDNTNTNHIDDTDYFHNICDKCYKYLGTKEITVGDNAITVDDIFFESSDDEMLMFRFVPKISGTYTISGAIFANNDLWMLIDEAFVKTREGSTIATSYSNESGIIEINLTAGETYYFVFGTINGYTLTITAPAHTCTGGTVQTCKGYVCTICGQYYGEKAAHKYTNYVSDNNATCTSDGTKTASCDYKCGQKSTITDEGSKLAHKYTNYVSDNNATCENNATQTAYCDYNCGEKDTKDIANSALGHSFTGDIKMDADGKDGTHSYACANGCGQYGNTTAHTWDDGTVATPATHLEKGVMAYECDCGAKKTEDIAKLEGHTYSETVVDPTCTDKGYTLHKCACGDSYKDNYVDALGHSFTGDIKMDADGKDGTHSYACANGCGQYGGTTSHVWDDGTVATPATHLEKGVMAYTCACGAKKIEDIAKLEGHTYIDTVVDPTCTDKGYTLHKCACGDSYKDNYVDAKGHSFTGDIKMDADGKDGTHSYACANGCGQFGGTTSHVWGEGTQTTPATHLEKGVMAYECACGAKKTEDIAKLEGHTYSETVVDPTCTDKGYTLHKCACGDSYKANYVDALGHNYDNGTCLNCGKTEPSDCTCPCHSSPIAKLVYMILDVIFRLFGSSYECRCGEAHF